jgi:dTDP-4-dehydrorhamnose reductase
VATKIYGIYHITNSGRCSWCEFTREILKLAGIKGVKVTPITSEELARPAPRPKFSVLDNCCLRLSLGNGMREWKEALKEYMKKNEGL